MNNFFLVVFNFLYLANVLIVGGFLLGLFKLAFSSKVEEKIYAFAFGNIFYSLLFIYLGFCHLLYAQVLIIFYLLPIIFYLSRLGIKYLTKSSWSDLGSVFNKKVSIKELIIFAIIGCLLLPIFPHLFSFPTSWDVVAYHLVLPKVYLRDHALSFYNWFAQTTFPIGIESLFSLGEVLGEPRISNFIVFDFVVMAIVYFVYGLRYLFKLRILLLAVVLFLFRKILYTEVSFNPYVDLPFAFYGLLISISLFKYFQNGRIKNLVMAFYLSFFTVLIKFTGIMIVFSLIATTSLFLISLKASQRKKIIISLIKRKNLLTGLFFCLPILLFFLRNYFYTSNPVYPFLNNIFKGLYYNEVDAKAMMADLRRQNLNFDMISGLVLRLGNQSAGTTLILRESLFSFVLVLFTALSLFSKERMIRYSAIFSLIFFSLVIFMVGFPSYRYALPLVPMMALLSSLAFWSFFKKRRFIQVGLIALFVYSLIIQTSSTFQYLKEFVLQNSKSGVKSMLSYEQVKRGLTLQDNWQAIEYINEHLDINSDKVLVLFDNRLYYYQVPVVYADPSSSSFFANQKARNTQEIYDQLKNDKITHLMANTNWGKPAKLESLLYEQFLKEKTVVEASYAGTMVYKIK